MSNNRLNTSASEIRNEACAWIAQLETGNATPEDLASFREWVQRSPRHAEEIRRAARVSADINLLTEFAVPLKAAAAHYDPVMRAKPRRWRMAAPLAAPMAVMLIVVATVMMVWQPFNTPSSQDVLLLATEIGEYREIALSDGSIVALNTDSRLEVDYADDQRLVRLLKGEALFTVASNPDRPFVVFAGDKLIKAVGTAFVVRFDRIAFEVAVTEGQVSVGDIGTDSVAPDSLNPGDRETPGEAVVGASGSAEKSNTTSGSEEFNTAPQTFILTEGQRWTDAGDASRQVVEFLSDQELQRKLAWREGLLDFSDTPLEEVIREVNRHTELKIEIADPSLSELKFGGLFRTGDPRPLFTALETNYGISLEYLDDGIVRLSKAADVEKF